MRIRIHNLLPLVVMLLLATLTLWLRQAAELGPQDTRQEDANRPDAVASGLSIVRLGEDGLPRYTMTAARMTHFDRGNYSLLEEPRFERRDPGGVTTAITSARARVLLDSDEAFFHGDVRMRRTTPARVLDARSEYLHVNPHLDLITSDRLVTISDTVSTLSGVGLEIGKASGQFTLKSQVKGSYHAPRKK